MKSLKDSLPKNQGDFYVKFNSENLPEYGFLVDGTLIVSFVNFTDRMPKMIFLPDLTDRIQPIDLDNNNYDVNEVVEVTLVHRNRKYLSGEVRLAKDCFKGVSDVTIVKTTKESLSINQNCFSPEANVSFILPENSVLKNVEINNDLNERTVYPLIIDKNVLGKIEDHINFGRLQDLSVKDYRNSAYAENFANISVDKDIVVKDDGFVHTDRGMERENF